MPNLRVPDVRRDPTADRLLGLILPRNGISDGSGSQRRLPNPSRLPGKMSVQSQNMEARLGALESSKIHQEFGIYSVSDCCFVKERDQISH
jgi:hypothetical protein